MRVVIGTGVIFSPLMSNYLIYNTQYKGALIVYHFQYSMTNKRRALFRVLVIVM